MKTRKHIQYCVMVIWQETRSISTFKNIKSAAQATCHVITNDQCKATSNSLTAISVALKKKLTKKKAKNDVSAPRRTLAEIRTYCAARWHIFSDYFNYYYYCYYRDYCYVIIIILFARQTSPGRRNCLYSRLTYYVNFSVCLSVCMSVSVSACVSS